MNSKLLIIYTGGTIGMRPSEQGYAPTGQFADLLVESLNDAAYSALAPFDLIELPSLIDSANIQLSHWEGLAQLVVDHYNDYAGFVILHGTDTMAYTASALSFMLEGLDKPVVFTGSQIPLSQPRSDAINNVLNAVAFARNPQLTEVAILFDNYLFRGNRSSKVHTSALRAFNSPNCEPIGHAGIDVTYFSHSALNTTLKAFDVPALKPCVSQLHLYPGISHDVIDAALSKPEIRGVIMSSFGAGNPPDSNAYLMDALEKARARGVIIVNLTQCHAGEVIQGAYATGARLNQLGIISGNDMTLEAAYTKLLILLSRGLNESQINSAFLHPIRGEMTP